MVGIRLGLLVVFCVILMKVADSGIGSFPITTLAERIPIPEMPAAVSDLIPIPEMPAAVSDLIPIPEMPAAVSDLIPIEPEVLSSAFFMQDELPYGCPVQPLQGRVVMTQGYGVGSHAPASVWGAIDLAVDGTGDGYANPGASQGAPIVATHSGVATVTMGSWPGGNYVSIRNGNTRTGYAHLQDVTVTSGQHVQAGQQIGTMGSTGMSTGPHLDYQVWRNGINIDPTNLVHC